MEAAFLGLYVEVKKVFSLYGHYRSCAISVEPAFGLPSSARSAVVIFA
jgi:hypothetical protein